MKYAMLIYCLSCFFIFSYGQDRTEKTGKISYKSSQNYYVNFGSTKGILVGDTLYVRKNVLIPVLIVKYLSSRSAAGEMIGNETPMLNDEVIALVKIKNDLPVIPKQTEVGEKDQIKHDSLVIKTKSISNELINGKFSIQSYSGFNNYRTGSDYQRWRYSLSLSANDIQGSGVSLNSYIIFHYRTNEGSEIKNNLFRALKIYDLSAKYDISLNEEIWFGRRLSPKLSNIGAIDGLQYEKRFSSYYTGAIIGSRPDYNDYGFNLKLLQYGAFIGRADSGALGIMYNTISIIQQTNNSKIDRRFIYFQHSNNLLANTSLFMSSEVDMYKREGEKGLNTFTLTGLFLSVRYSPGRVLAFNVSYDARKNVIYYETFKNFTDSLIENETRQGIRLGINIRPLNNLSGGMSLGYRYRPGDLKPSRNLNSYLSLSVIPVIEASSTLNYNYLTGSYIEGNVWDISLNKELWNLINFSVSYRRTAYNYFSFSGKSIQDNLIMELSSRIGKNVYLTGTWDSTFEKQFTTGRILLNLTTRF